MSTLTIVVVVLVVVGLGLSVRIVQQYQKGVLFRLGRVVGVREPVLTLIIPARSGGARPAWKASSSVSRGRVWRALRGISYGQALLPMNSQRGTR